MENLKEAEKDGKRETVGEGGGEEGYCPDDSREPSFEPAIQRPGVFGGEEARHPCGGLGELEREHRGEDAAVRGADVVQIY